ncbi:MAG: phosphoribosyltransferase family protein [Candidatus Woesebacteria bacterium]|nr:phosphoribosyltransferase family protein [Candidatus Woesebacteria bacterium]
MFEDRCEAGNLLAERLTGSKASFDVVLAIPRGGVVVGRVIADKLHLPLYAMVVKKVPTAGQPELAAGAVGPEGVSSGEKSSEIEKIVGERIKKFGQLKNLRGKSVLLVDDGIATGATVETAIKYLKKKNVGSITLAIPVAPGDIIDKIRKEIDSVIFLVKPREFYAVGDFYRCFPQVTDEEVLQLLQND